jgi:hypothetical protein
MAQALSLKRVPSRMKRRTIGSDLPGLRHDRLLGGACLGRRRREAVAGVVRRV